MKGITTKPCRRCGKLLFNVNSAVRYCDACAEIVKKESRKRDADKRKSTRPRGRPKGSSQMNGEKESKKARKNGKPYTKSIEECVKEAESMNLTYGEYVALGYDKEGF